jgi:AraC-like DNA-binding protein
VLIAVVLNDVQCGTGSEVEVLMPKSAFDSIAEHVGARKLEALTVHPGENTPDPVLAHLEASLESAMDSAAATDPCLLDGMAAAILLHVAQRFGCLDAPQPAPRGGLAPWQLRIARRRLEQKLESDLALADIAAECGLSSSHFTRAFCASTGVPPHRWLMQRRVERAKALMLSEDTSLAQIAAHCGFADQSHFTRAFASLIGLPPARWRVTQEQA